MTPNLVEGIDFSGQPLPNDEYELCTFTRCTFTNADLSKRAFYDCTFTDCTFVGAKLNRTALREVTFVGCDLTGLRFDHCDPFLLALRFKRCTLTKASFEKLSLKETYFGQSVMHRVDFTQTDLTEAVFDECDLDGARFDYTVLERADFRTARHYALDPERNRLKKARFAWPGLVGLLVKYGIEVG
ncbi:pentapeptide repeat-containing protein [Fibrella sp. WM1]|uniref:pentapeptide repeat-containing protein n=1 Tax=Fibrella musci TaxID=3242485 RepID=UPI003522D15D